MDIDQTVTDVVHLIHLIIEKVRAFEAEYGRPSVILVVLAGVTWLRFLRLALDGRRN